MPALIYLRQCGDARTLEEKRKWFQECAKEATDEGCTYQRHSIHPDHTDLLLVEGWDSKPEFDGEQRWQLTIP